MNNLVCVRICEFLDLKSLSTLSLVSKYAHKFTKLDALWKLKVERFLWANDLEIEKEDKMR